MAVLAAGLLAVPLPVGCDSRSARAPALSGAGSSTGAGLGSGAGPAPSRSSAPPPAAPAGQPPFARQRPPSAAPGRLATWAAPAGTARYSVRLWYAGVPLGRDDAGLLVAYPAMFVSATGGRAVAHLKVPVFRCAGRNAPASPNFHGCGRRRVEYSDLAAPAVRIGRRAGNRITVVGRFPTYTYGPAVDRDPRLAVRWTGRAFLVRVDAEPGRALQAAGAVVGLGTVTLGSGAAAVSATVDAGYPNRLDVAYS